MDPFFVNSRTYTICISTKQDPGCLLEIWWNIFIAVILQIPCSYFLVTRPFHVATTKNQFFFWVFFHEHSQITGLHGKGEGISLTHHYYFHPLQGYLDISRAITAESSPLRIASSRTRTGNLWFPSASR